jgi:hypothetical protein
LKKKTLLLIAYRAFGDWLYTLPVLGYLFKNYEIVLECSPKVGLLTFNDPRFKKVGCFNWADDDRFKDKLNISRLQCVKIANVIFNEREKILKEKYKPDKIINLGGSIECVCIPENFQKEFYWSLEERRNKYSTYSFYDAVLDRVGLKSDSPKLDDIYYASKEIEWAEGWRKKHKDKFIILLAVAGSTYPKIFHNFREYMAKVLDLYPDVLFYVTGDDKVSKLIPKHDRIKNACFHNSYQDVPIKQIFLMAKYADYVIGPETGAVVAAGVWGTPKTMLCTMSSIIQCTKYQKNDYSIQSPISCSPCLRAVYDDLDCSESLGSLTSKKIFAPCTKQFKTDDLVEILKVVRENKTFGRGNFAPHLAEKYPSLNKGG